jgi:hypothetical protein
LEDAEMKTRREHIEDTLEDLISNLFYYDRKEDEDLPRGAIEQAVANGEISQEEIIALLANHIKSHLLCVEE